MELTRKEGEEENEGRTALTEERDKQNMLYQQALQNENFQSNPRDNPLGHATNNQMTEETSTGLRPQTLPGTQTQSLTIPNDSQSGNDPQRQRPTPQTETGLPAQELTRIDVENPPQVPNEVQVPRMEREFNISFGVIGSSGTMLSAYHSLDRNKLTSRQMVLYEASIWLLYLTFFFGGIMLAITIIRPFTHNLRTFYCLLCLAAGAGYYAIGFAAYLLLPESTIKLVIICVIPIALLLVAMILHFKDKKIVLLFRFKQHPN